MNVRRQLYKKYRLEGFSGYAAARKAGYSHNTAKNALENLEKRGKGETFDQFLEIAGLTDDTLAKHALEGSQAERVIAVESDDRDPMGKKVYVNVTVPDWATRHKYFETILKLRGKLQAAIINANINQIGVNTNGEDDVAFRNAFFGVDCKK
jgi:hypothetical protein